MDEPAPPPRKPGRPRGAKNKPKESLSVAFRKGKGTSTPHSDYAYSDPMTMVARQFSILDAMQQCIRHNMQQGLKSKVGYQVTSDDVKDVVNVSNALKRTIESLDDAYDIAERLAAKKTPAELLEIAIKTIEGQDLPTLESIIRRLTKYREWEAPTNGTDRRRMIGYPTGEEKREKREADKSAADVIREQMEPDETA